MGLLREDTVILEQVYSLKPYSLKCMWIDIGGKSSLKKTKQQHILSSSIVVFVLRQKKQQMGKKLQKDTDTVKVQNRPADTYTQLSVTYSFIFFTQMWPYKLSPNAIKFSLSWEKGWVQRH